MTDEHPLFEGCLLWRRLAPVGTPCVRSERGQALVEFALILPVFMLLILGMIDFGAAYNDHNDMTQLAAEAVRYAAVNSCGTCAGGTSAIVTQVKNDANNTNLVIGGGGAFGTDQALQVCFGYPNSGGTTYNDNSANNVAGSPVTAIVETNYNWLPFLGLAKVQLKATATERIETQLNGNSTDAYTVTANGNDCPGYKSP